MVSDTRSARKNKDEEDARGSKKKIDTRKDPSMPSPGKAQTSGVRRSTRETTAAKQTTQSPKSIRKSKRLDRETPPSTPNLKRKFDRLEKHNSPSPVRRSGRRGKKIVSSSSSGSKKSAKELCPLDSKIQKEKNLIQVTMESEKAEIDREAVGMKRRKMNSRSFMSLFKSQRIKILPDGELEGRDKFSDVCSDNSGGVGSGPRGSGEDVSDECSGKMVRKLRDESIDKASDEAHQKSTCSLKDCNADTENGVDMDSNNRDDAEEPGSKHSHTSSSVRETLDYPERLPTNCSNTENMSSPKSENSTCLAKTQNGSVCSDISEKCVHSKEFAPSPSPKFEIRSLLGPCDVCSKNKRIGYNSPEQELCSCNPTVEKDLGSVSTCKDRSDHKAAVTTETAGKCDSRHLFSETCADSQIDGHENVCALCNKSGELLCCEGKGCKRFYHVCCLDPPLSDALPGLRHCPQCVKKKLLFGVHSVSDGVESIWDVREVEVSNVKGVRQRQYLVKYHGLAHIHNHWVPEKQLLLENPSLVANFIEKDQVVRWNTEWTVPHRLLRKRSIPDNIYIAYYSEILVCNYEWLVKWHGLGYDHVTWELDNANCLSSPLGLNLMKDYENRRQKAMQETNQRHKGSIVQLSELPASPSLVNDDVLKNVNKLHECLFKCQNAVVFDDQERAMTIIFLLQSMSDICRPFLIVTASSSLSQWEAEFARLVPSVDVVVYSGNRDTRKGIRSSEFYDEGGHLMLQILLSSAEVVVEDLESLRSIKWEAVVIDEYQQFGISNDLGRIKQLNTDSRILLVSGQIKDMASEYLKMLYLLESDGDCDKQRGLKSETNDSLCKLKDRLSCFIAYGSNSHVSKFLEYWVPVQISNFQLEQYCATLLSNSVHLCCCSRNDRVGALRDILLTVQKCCAHPYLVDPSVQARLVAEKCPADELLDFGIKASGKLVLLDMMLTEIKTRGLQVLVLFQLIKGPEASNGDILDDFLSQRFGPKSFERVEHSVIPSKKQASVKGINEKEDGQFIFLLENRACSYTIKLSSLDVVIIYDSNWNPANDLRALQKLSIGSKVEQIKVFRLYSSFTVEESALILAKKNLILDNNLQNSSRTTSNALLFWGAQYLFSKLDEYHHSTTSAVNFSSGQLHPSEVIKEFQVILSENCENTVSNAVISKVKLGVGSYSTNIPMLGETKVQLKDGEEPHIFWKNLLDGKNYGWKHLMEPSPRNRKRVHYFEGSPSKSTTKRDDVVKKRKKMANGNLDPTLVEVQLRTDQVAQDAIKEGSSTIKTCNQSQNLQKDCNISNNNSNGMPSDEQKTLHGRLQAEMMTLCRVLKLSEDVTDVVRRFLEYIIKNKNVKSDSPAVVQALQISLCWIAASIRKQKIAKKETLMLAKQLLNYQCTEEQANTVYSVLKDMYSQCSEKIVISGRDFLLAEQENIGNDKTAASELGDNEKIKKLQKSCNKRMKKLRRKHQVELQEFHRNWEEKRVKLEKDHKLELELIQVIYGEGSVRTDKVKLSNDDFTEKMEKFNLEKDAELKDLEAKQLAAIDEEKKKVAQWLAEVTLSSKPQSLGPQSEEDVVELNDIALTAPISAPAEEIGCETRAENLVTVNNSQNEVGVSSLAMNDLVSNQSKHSSDDPETVVANVPARSVGTVTDEVVGHVDSVEERNASQGNITAPDALLSQICEPDEASGGGLPTPIQSLVHPEQTVVVPDCSNLSLQVQQDKNDQNLVSTEQEVPDEPAVENQSTSQIEVELVDTVNPLPSNLESPVMPDKETVTSVPSNHETPMIENSVQLHQSPAIEDNDQGRCSSQTAEHGATDALPRESIPQSGENLEVHNNHLNNTGSVSNALQLSTISQNDVTIPQIVASSTAEHPNQTVLQLGNNAGQLVGPRANFLHSTHQPTWSSSPSSSADPLHNELEKLCRENEQLEKHHKEMMSQLKSDCEKEIQELIGQIRCKYEAKLQENDVEFGLKKNELEENQNKVFMNKILAEVFRAKCLDPKPLGIPGVPASLQHVHQATMQPLLVRPAVAPPQLPAPPTHPITSPPPVQTAHQLSRAHPVIRSPNIPVQNVSTPPLQAVQNTAALFSGGTNPRPPPHISVITPARNSRVGGELRAPAPHLQSFRPPTAAVGPTTASPLVSQFRLPSLPPSPAVLPMSPVVTSLVASQNNRASSPLPEINHTFDALEVSDLEILGNVGGHETTSVATGVVCLSDDE